MVQPLLERQPADRGVSPVIGVILMVAITVILASVVGTFVLGIGQSAATERPQVSFTFEWDSETGAVTVVHYGGETLDSDNSASVTVDVGATTTAWSMPISAGSSITVTANSGQTVRVIWAAPSGETQVVGAFEVP